MNFLTLLSLAPNKAKVGIDFGYQGQDTLGVIGICIYQRRTDNTMAKKKVQKDKQRSTKHTYKTKDRVTGTPLKTGGELMCSGRVSNLAHVGG